MDGNLHRADLKPCAVCGRGLAHDNHLVAYRVTIDQLILDTKAVMREHGLETFLGGGATGAMLADAMGADPALYLQTSRVTNLICQECFLGRDTSIAQAWEEK